MLQTNKAIIYTQISKQAVANEKSTWWPPEKSLSGKKFEKTKNNAHLDFSLNIRYPKLFLITNIKSIKLFRNIIL